MAVVKYTAEELHPVSRDGRPLAGQEFDGHDILDWIERINAGKMTIDQLSPYRQKFIPEDAIRR